MVYNYFMDKKKRVTRLFCLAVLVVFFVGFFLMTYWTPPAGDDWVYAWASRGRSPFALTLNMYQNWSGRVLSEFWGYTVADHKAVWNLINPLLFTGILFLLHRLADDQREIRPVSSLFLAVLLILCVPDRMRMQTYTWIMGTTYVIPLFLFLLIMVLLRRELRHEKGGRWRYGLLCILCFCQPLYMENASALMCFSELLILLFLFFEKRKEDFRRVLLLFCLSFAAALIVLLSPGAHARLMSSNADFAALSLGEKIVQNWPLFLEHTFTDSPFLMRVLWILLAIWTIEKGTEQKKNRIGVLLSLPFWTAVFFNSGGLDLACILYAMVLFVLWEKEKEKKAVLLFATLCALGANAVMMLSPIFDYRSALYTYYLFILLILLLFKELVMPKPAVYASLAFVVVAADSRALSYYRLYHMVGLIAQRRSEQIAMYQASPELEDIWIMGFPTNTIHSADVLEGDTVHDEAFHGYYELNPDAVLHFYYLDVYDYEHIRNG